MRRSPIRRSDSGEKFVMNQGFYVDFLRRTANVSVELPALQGCFTMNGAIQIIAGIGLILAYFSVLPSNPLSK
jgi:hypothetical protein